jgi:hypothetical protein
MLDRSASASRALTEQMWQCWRSPRAAALGATATVLQPEVKIVSMRDQRWLDKSLI